MSKNPHIRTARLDWTGSGLAFTGRGGSSEPISLDGDSKAGPSPMEGLLLSMAGCMAIDIRVILDKSRVPLDAMSVEIEGERRPEAPKRFERVRMVFRFEGPGEDHRGKIERAIELSETKYCSVHHTLRPDLDVTSEYELEVEG